MNEYICACAGNPKSLALCAVCRYFYPLEFSEDPSGERTVSDTKTNKDR